MIQGGGYIAVEFACIFAGLGAEVTLVYRGEKILRGFDDDVREHLRDEMERRGITCDLRPHRRRRREGGRRTTSTLLSDGDTHRRRPGDVRHRPPSQHHGLGLESVGVKLAEHGGDRGR